MAYKAVLFDLDGTLLDTLEDLANSMNRVLAAQGFPTHPIDAYRYFVGDGLQMLVARTVPEEQRSDEVVINESIRRFNADYGQSWNIKTRPYEGVPEMLDTLGTRGLPLAILSNKPHAFTQHCVSALLADWPFAVVLGQREGIPRKPDPAGAVEIAEMLNVLPAEFLYLGDTGTDMQTAVAAGMFPVGVLWGFRTREELQQNGAQVLLDRPADLFSLLSP
ncbi:HAD-IA family hydrolase [candidate division KSB3 bacterium]|uniref:HAD-IA family hydrolase n=1 Tax=candidate division KSB3 bacterium TaxID=2044937 RepID=A0A9D5JXE9_9BACT|nr:HAD-IA family hydrolase [candidate division KSB3 bacterium]MBD3325612.1 HAD-IA family hydrolase [candidate division KSB3 bacterium]